MTGLRRLFGYTFWILFIVQLFGVQTAELIHKGDVQEEKCRTLEDLSKFRPQEKVNLSQYGGWKKKKFNRTGFFHAFKDEEHWWLVDPEGYAFFSLGVNSVNLGNLKRSTTPNDQEVAWGERTSAMLRGFGFNTLGCWSDAPVVQEITKPMPYCLRWNFMPGYRNQRRSKYPSTGEFNTIYPFDEEFGPFCIKQAESAQKSQNDPWLFGHFSDNELTFTEKGIVKEYLKHPPNDPNHMAAKKFMADRGRKEANAKDDSDFLKLVVDTYYRKVSAALKKNDPNHMFLGSRFHGRALDSPALFLGSGKHTDLISVNYYHRWTPESERIDNWSTLADKPILITEFYAMSKDTGLSTDKGAGFTVKAQQDRAYFYQHFALSLLENKNCVGWHWFRYRDGRTNTGIVNEKEKPYPLLTQVMRKINQQAYPLIQFFTSSQ
jgi:hypothetical protein